MFSSLTLLSVGLMGHILSLAVLYKTKIKKHRTVFYTLLCALIWTDLWGQVSDFVCSPLPSKHVNFHKIAINRRQQQQAIVKKRPN